VIVRAAIISALVLCTSCVSGTYERDIAFEPVKDEAVEPLKIGASDVGDALARLGAPLYVWEGVNESIVLAYGSKVDRGWGVRAARNVASLSYDSLTARLEGWILVFGTDNKLQIVRKGLLADLALEARHPPAYVE
jgi:hypothetical protein